LSEGIYEDLEEFYLKLFSTIDSAKISTEIQYICRNPQQDFTLSFTQNNKYIT